MTRLYVLFLSICTCPTRVKNKSVIPGLNLNLSVEFPVENQQQLNELQKQTS